ncbi:MAG TPA: hypothetical protein PKI05_14910, partial [Thermogutta sp.]|nr:hypothetical protein [Thermogutta sp.]
IQADDAVIGEPPRCEACGHPVGMRAWLPPVRVNFEVCRDGYCDFVFPPVNDILVSSRFKQIYESEGLTGLSGFDPVEIVKIKPKRRAKEPPPAYFRVFVARSQAVVDPEASGFDPPADKPVCPVCRIGSNRKRWKKLVIQPGTWSGEDVFFPRGCTGDIIVSERFKMVCEAHGVTNALLIPVEEYGYDFYPHETKDWDIRKYEETLAVLRTMNRAGRLDDYVEAMEEMRKYVLADPKFDWLEELRERFEGKIDPIGDAAHDAYYNLIAPWYAKYVRKPKGPSRRT